MRGNNVTQNYGKILIVDDDQDILQAASLLLKKHVTLVHTEKDPNRIPTLLKNESYDVILLDMNFTEDVTSGREGFLWLNNILEIDPSVIIILITAYGDIEMAVQAVKEGATDFVLKPWQNEKLVATVSASLLLRKSRLEADQLRYQQKQLSADMDQQFQDIIGNSHAMQKIYSAIQKVAKTDANILILGENGTGKELIARAIHRHSLRVDKVFISLDMGAVSETLFESELFGHVKGAFTDAKEERAGRFEIASGGTLFLDEIGNIPISLQAKLLTVLQNREIIRVGSNQKRPIDIRLICATNLPINDLVKTNKFRQDLLYRINTVEIKLPALRERIEDIPLLAEHFLKSYSKKYQKKLKRLAPATIKKLERYSWPGNVRELQHAIERATILSDSHVLQPSDFFFSIPDTAEEEIKFDDYNLETMEKLVIQKAIQKYQGNISKAARELGLTRTSLYRRMEKYGI
jgi:DNA-binding NtrC family response regulator